jgi:hypothetical protein
MFLGAGLTTTPAARCVNRTKIGNDMNAGRRSRLAVAGTR